MRVALLCVLVACGGSPGKLVNVRRDPATFVHEHQALLVDTAGGLVRINTDGSGRESLVSSRYIELAFTPDASILALGDSNTNLYVYDGREPRRVPELDRRTGNVAISPDGSRLAVTRHADFSLPQASWSETEDDAIYLVDTHSLAVEIIPKDRDELVTSMWWDADGIVLGMFHFDWVRVDPVTKQRTKLPAMPPHGTPPACTDQLVLRGWRGDEGIDIVTAAGTRRLVVIDGRSRGFHDYQPTIANETLTASCRYAVFQYRGAIWIADVATTAVGYLIRGGGLRLLR